ncbi:hypothetical protein D9615_001973 [Tricholomella constricta]|uniref:Uncharacterized protein n=1 Tax=Tricholomella constricta TaxID=117010 RepID=A0A8H5MAE2_9AGAR|nr:hypothetical protein D9615_001973 [Tricholomella constricta]
MITFTASIALPLNEEEGIKLLEPLDIFNDNVAQDEHPFIQVFTVPAHSLLFAGSQGLPPLSDQITFSSGPDLEAAAEKIDDALVISLGKGTLELPEVDDDDVFDHVEYDVVAAPREKRIPLPLRLGQDNRVWGLSSPTSPVVPMATGSLVFNNFSPMLSPGNVLLMCTTSC